MNISRIVVMFKEYINTFVRSEYKDKNDSLKEKIKHKLTESKIKNQSM